MHANFDHLRRLLERIRTISFWDRLFRWRRVRDQLIDANGDFERLWTDYTRERANGEALAGRNELLAERNDHLTAEVKRLSESEGANSQAVTKLANRKNELDLEILAFKKDLERTQDELDKARDQLVVLHSEKEQRNQEFGERMATLKQYQEKIQMDRDREVQDRHEAELSRLKNMKDTWVLHQENVRQNMKALCSRHTIEYVDKVAFRGEPDNTVSVCGEFIIFDAKSPRGEDLSNFAVYVREQAEKARKYANEEKVKNWIFFVIPMNTLGVIRTFVHAFADYQVFVVSVDAIEPILLSLKKIGDYEFADQLDPEDRENICRILGKFAHLSKRRIQIDAYFINQFMELAYKCESDLPADVFERAIEFERTEKLNPPQERSAKAIPMAGLEKALTKVQNDAINKGILLEDNRLTRELNEVPLYKAD
jgi:hypothetical protein